VTETKRLESMDEIVRYIRENRGTYTDDAIREQLRKAGNQDWAINDAFKRADRQDIEERRDPRRWWLFVGYAVGLFVLVFALFAFASDMQQKTYGIGTAVLGVTMVLGLITALVVVRRNRDFALGISSGVVTALIVPFVVLFLIAGLCVATTNPTFFPASGS
jgi:peptidoglycan/LPS O-acetylase OafA/YrhL